MLRLFFVLVCIFSFPLESIAGRTYWVNINNGVNIDAAPSFDCAALKRWVNSEYAVITPSCETIQGKLKTVAMSEEIKFTVSYPAPDSRVFNGFTMWNGNCLSGRQVGNYDVKTGYVNWETQVEILHFQNTSDVRFSKSGCIVRAIDIAEGGCVADRSTDNPAVGLAHCTAMFAETGELGDPIDGKPAEPAKYVGDGSVPGSGGGTPGDGTGGGGTGGDGTGGDGTGGGTNPGGGGTTPGGGTSPGTGTGGGSGGGTGGGSGGVDFCVAHPTLTVCKLSSVSGSCGQIQCSGDAVQCAAYREAALARCDTKVRLDELRDSEFAKLSERVLAGDDPLKNSLPSPDKAQVIDIKSLDKSGFLGGGSCFPDKNISVLGHSVVIPFSQACSVLIALRFAIMIMASMACFKMLRSTFMGA